MSVAPQDGVCPFGCQGSLLIHVDPAVRQQPLAPFHCLLSSPVPTSTQESPKATVRAGLLPSHSSPNLFLCLALPCPRCRIRRLDFFNSMPLMIAQLSNLCRSLCKASYPWRESAAPPCLVLTANLLRVHSTPTSRSLIETLNRTGPWLSPEGYCWCHQQDVAPFTTSLWVLPFTQF